MNITVYGAASDRIDRIYVEKVEELGKEMAKRNHTLVYGAGDSGLMGAVARGEKSGGGEIIGVAPKFMKNIEPLFKDCTKMIFTDTLSERKDTMESLADAFIIVPGGVGTFDEFYQALTLRSLGRFEKPIVLYNVCNYWDGMLSVIGTNVLKGFITPKISEYFSVCYSASSALDEIEKRVKK